MSTIYRLRTFSDLYTAIREELQIASNDTLALNRIKRDLNVVYQEIAGESNWEWLRGKTNLILPAAYTDSCSVTQNSVSVTLATALTISQDNNYFSIIGQNEIYRIASHTAGASALTLDVPFVGSTSASVNYKIWQERVALPSNCRETVMLSHNYNSNPMQNLGLQEYRRLVATSPKAETRPIYYHTADYVDPDPYTTPSGLPSLTSRSSAGYIRTLIFNTTLGSSDSSALLKAGDVIQISSSTNYQYNGEFIISSLSTTNTTNDTITYTATTSLQESATTDVSLAAKKKNSAGTSERYREILLYPSIMSSNTVLHLDYIKELNALENDTDEPLIPEAFRSVLLYGALHRAWSRLRNPEEAKRNFSLYEKTLERMRGKLEDSVDLPVLSPSTIYMGAKRFSGSRRGNTRPYFRDGFGGTSSATQITGTASAIAIYDAAGFLSSAVAGGDISLDSNLKTQIDAGVIVDADINAAAAITRSKTATGTAYVILANNSSGVMSENAALTPGQAVMTDVNGQLTTSAASTASLTYLTDAEGLTSATLTDNTSSAANVATWTVASFSSFIIHYSLNRGAGIRATGDIRICSDGSTVGISRTEASIGTNGVTFTADISAGSIRLRYITTSTGTDATMKYKLLKWLA